MKINSFLLASILFYSSMTFANMDLITWKGTYFGAIPNKAGISKRYCEEHVPGSFIHVVKPPLSRPLFTDKGIRLDRSHFNMEKIHDFYIIHGDFWANGKTNGKEWHDHIYYHFTKLTEAGDTKGVWSSPECKGFYLGVAIKNGNV